MRSRLEHSFLDTRDDFLAAHKESAEAALHGQQLPTELPDFHVALLVDLDDALYAIVCERLQNRAPIELPEPVAFDREDLRAQLVYYLAGSGLGG